MRVVGSAGASWTRSRPAVLRGPGAARPRSLPPSVPQPTPSGRPQDGKRGPGPWAGPRHSTSNFSKSDRRSREMKSKQTNVVLRRAAAAATNHLKRLYNFAEAGQIRGVIRQQGAYRGA